ncbi:NYN domain-containing protein [Thermoleptolyngbya sichuanensis XZ-Cy5]|uniref:NYN domain-containing protein n=1 Tax=Thermoleptolyngbya sichuanensis TaxID=2885951 RepID=UPI00240E571E|nr:NYN domain-containing protein [Thermoleptolyngbya sichuanensis]MDG2614832.1 NYN domain-containing protein [Thermoleptolyngbya sichuanensis XZ-Cy5]
MRGEVQLRPDRLAVLIDADNVNADVVEPLFKEVSKYGTAYIKRIYGDWTTPQLKQWKDKLSEFAIQPVQQFPYTKGKNATDAALIIEAMDLLYTQNFDGFCIVSSDSDFTPLASRIRASGLVVYGFGERLKTPRAFVQACDKFTYIDILQQTEALAVAAVAETKESPLPKANQAKSGATVKLQPTNLEEAKSLLQEVYEVAAEDESWVELGLFGNRLTQLHPDFDSRTYGCKQLKQLVKVVDIFDVQETPNKSVQIKLKA